MFGAILSVQERKRQLSPGALFGRSRSRRSAKEADQLWLAPRRRQLERRDALRVLPCADRHPPRATRSRAVRSRATPPARPAPSARARSGAACRPRAPRPDPLPLATPPRRSACPPAKRPRRAPRSRPPRARARARTARSVASSSRIGSRPRRNPPRSRAAMRDKPTPAVRLPRRRRMRLLLDPRVQRPIVAPARVHVASPPDELLHLAEIRLARRR